MIFEVGQEITLVSIDTLMYRILEIIHGEIREVKNERTIVLDVKKRKNFIEGIISFKRLSKYVNRKYPRQMLALIRNKNEKHGVVLNANIPMQPLNNLFLTA